jgi:hemerythrin
MQRLKWKANYTIGIPTIDRQHRKIFENLADLERAITKRQSSNEIQFLIKQLAANLDLHWAVEEALLEIIRYPQIEEHRRSHAKLSEVFAKFEIQLGGHQPLDEVVKFFETWFIEHVLAGDADYLVYARKKYPEEFGL